MVTEQIMRRGLHDARLLAAFDQVPRHLFVPESSRFAAYDDTPLPIGFGQTISQPYIVALMTESLDLCGSERVLEVGTGSGYQAAILARLAGEIHTTELIPELSERAATLLHSLEYHNVHVHTGDGSLGWPPFAPYASIMVTAAAPRVPPPLLEQLADGGRLVAPIENRDDYQSLKVITRHDQEFVERVITSVAFVPLRGKYGRKGI
jgi:protein-L-isoaspartate(D-aspartate) O-methyltransferase